MKLINPIYNERPITNLGSADPDRAGVWFPMDSLVLIENFDSKIIEDLASKTSRR